jgi:ferritin
MDKKLEKAFQDQIKNELYSGYMYLSMAAYSEAKNLPGFARWFKVQAKEENIHAMKIFDFLNDLGIRVILEAIPQPPSDFSSPQDLFVETLAHEKKVTALINKLFELAIETDDHASREFLHWFIKEQVEEEKNPAKILADLEMIKSGSGVALIMLDRELAKREG